MCTQPPTYILYVRTDPATPRTGHVISDDGDTLTVGGLVIGSSVIPADRRLIHVVNDLIVTQGASLTIEAGAEFTIDPNRAIIVQGKLNILGNATHKCRFSSNVSETVGTAGVYVGCFVDSSTHTRSTHTTCIALI